MTTTNLPSIRLGRDLAKDVVAGVVVFLVALPLCLGIALASNAPLMSGVVSGIIGGIVVGLLSGSHTSVSGPAAGLTAVVVGAIAAVGSFEGFLVAVVLAGAIQIVLGLVRGGIIAAFFPGSVIKGLLAAIGLILILKQLPHLLGHDADSEGEMSFAQPDRENTFTELLRTIGDLHPGAMAIGVASLLLLLVWDRTRLKKLLVPAPLVVVVGGVLISLLLAQFGAPWLVQESHRVQVPVANGPTGLLGLLKSPDWSLLTQPIIYKTAFVLAIIASLETLLNLEAVDKLDPLKRRSPPDRELVAQGVGNVLAGVLGGLPMTSVIVRSSVNVNAGARTKVSAVVHGALLLAAIAAIPHVLNLIPLSALAAILIATGAKLASPKLFKQMWREGLNQFLPFAITIVAILFTDLLIGTVIGLNVAVFFILHSNMKHPMRRVLEHHVAGDVLRIELANQVSFLNRGRLARTLHEVPRGSHVLIDARNCEYIDPDVLDLIEDFRTATAPAHGVTLSLTGFKLNYKIPDQVQFVDFTSREVQSSLTPARVLATLAEGNRRFRTGERLTRDLHRQIDATATGQFPMAVVLSCIDSRSPVEIIFDLGVGDAFVIRIAGNVAREKVLASMEYSCIVAGAKLILVMGHTRCGAVNAAIDLFGSGKGVAEATGCEHLEMLVTEIQRSIPDTGKPPANATADERRAFGDIVARRNVVRTVNVVREQSKTLEAMRQLGNIDIVGGLYDISTGNVEFFDHQGRTLTPA